MSLRLLIGNKNYSSWSLRSWLLLRQAAIPFEEIKLSFNDPGCRDTVRRYSPAGRVPVLIDDEFVVWDTLAIAEYLAERFPEHELWPADPRARARARSVCAEMHAGFEALRRTMPMNCEARFRLEPVPIDAQRDIDRIIAIWVECRERFGAGGEFLFGRFGVADAYFAPVVLRFEGHGVALPPVAARYAKAMLELDSLAAWVDEGLVEHDFVECDEPYRTAP